MKLTLHVILHYTPKDIESSTESRISRPKTALQDEELGFLIASFFLENLALSYQNNRKTRMAPEVSNSPNAWMFRSGCGASKLTKKHLLVLTVEFNGSRSKQLTKCLDV